MILISLSCFSYIYFLTHSNSFINIFKFWGKESLCYPVRDKTLKRDIIIITLTIFSSSILETVILHLDYFPQLDFLSWRKRTQSEAMKKSTLEVYFDRSHPEWGRILGYHYNPMLAILAFTSHKLVLFCWIYADTFIILFARVLYFKFQELSKKAKENLNGSDDILWQRQKSAGKNQIQKIIKSCLNFNFTILFADRKCWANIVKDHDTLCSVLKEVEKFLSPLVFGSYAVNLYYICMQVGSKTN